MSEKKHPKHTLIIHIGTAFIRAGLSPDGSTELSHVRRFPIGFGSKLVRNSLLEHTKKTLRDACNSYHRHHIASVKIVLSSPWHHAGIRSVRSTVKPGVSITPDLVLHAVEKYKNEEPPKAGREDMEAVAVQVRVDGYPTALAKPVEGNSLKINLYESEIDTDVKNAFITVPASAFPHATVSLYSFPLAFSLGIRTVTQKTSFIAIDVGGEVSDLTIVDHDALSYLASIPSGYYTVARAIGGEKEGGVQDALARLAVLARGELEEKEHARLDAALDEAFNPWIRECATALKHAAAHVPIPRTIFLLSDGCAGSWIASKLQTTFEHHDIRVIDTKLIQSVVKPARDGGAYDVPLALLSAFFELASGDIFGSFDASKKPKKKLFAF